MAAVAGGALGAIGRPSSLHSSASSRASCGSRDAGLQKRQLELAAGVRQSWAIVSTTFASLRLGLFAFLSSNSPGISTRDPLPLRLCTLASLRSFLPTAPGSLREIHDVRARRPKLLCTNRAWAVPRIIVRATAALLKFALLTKTKGQKPSSTGEMHSVTAKHKPNAGLVQGSFTVAGLLGLLTQSYIVFGVALLVLLAMSLHDHSIRL